MERQQSRTLQIWSVGQGVKTPPFHGGNAGSNPARIMRFPVMMRSGDTPVPIPNTTVKTWAVDGTWRAAAWESRWSPEFYGLIAQPVRARA